MRTRTTGVGVGTGTGVSKMIGWGAAPRQPRLPCQTRDTTERRATDRWYSTPPLPLLAPARMEWEELGMGMGTTHRMMIGMGTTGQGFSLLFPENCTTVNISFYTI